MLIGIETTGHYHEIIVRYLQEFGYDVLFINAYTTSENRAENLNWSKTYDIELSRYVHHCDLKERHNDNH